MVVLAVRRAARTGLDVVVATPSIDEDDHHLAEILSTYRIRQVRGPASNMLELHAIAISDLDDTDICVCLNSNNVFPDGEFVQRLIEQAAVHGHVVAGDPNGAPLGGSAEAIRVSLIRQAARSLRGRHARELEVYWLAGPPGYDMRPSLLVEDLELANLRCGIDTLEDYRNVSAALAGLSDPVMAPWQELCRRLAQWMERARPFVPARIVAGELQASLVVGTAQLGLNYGISNVSGRPADQEVVAILDLAERHGITHLDTAAGYGDSERRIGSTLSPDSAFRLITKLPPDLLDGRPSATEAARRVRAAVDRSQGLLRRPRLDAVLLHRFEHYDGPGGAVWQALLSLKAAEKIGRVGVSIYQPLELLKCLEDPGMGLVQIPFNILDQRWLEPEVQSAVAARPDVILHGRSALLQGLLTIDDPLRWPVPDIDTARSCIDGLKRAVSMLGRENVVDLCFAYVRAQPWLAAIVVGAETAAQMAENVRLFRLPALSDEDATTAARSLPAPLPHILLNPALWIQN